MRWGLLIGIQAASVALAVSLWAQEARGVLSAECISGGDMINLASHVIANENAKIKAQEDKRETTRRSANVGPLSLFGSEPIQFSQIDLLLDRPIKDDSVNVIGIEYRYFGRKIIIIRDAKSGLCLVTSGIWLSVKNETEGSLGFFSPPQDGQSPVEIERSLIAHLAKVREMNRNAR